ncbi:hypothetical protein PGTDC60_1250 [Porphyromonas gingivalis TDC60]|nr:hypothetical protein PGTDC60_1250 [Porphyromonas gingivalis TDC60]
MEVKDVFPKIKEAASEFDIDFGAVSSLYFHVTESD